MGVGPLDLLWVSNWTSHVEQVWSWPSFAHFIHRVGRLGRVILFDPPGIGLSDPVSLHELPSIEQWLDYVRVVMDAAGSERAVLLGNAAATGLSVSLAATHPDRVGGLVLFAPFARVHRAADYPVRLSRRKKADVLAELPLFSECSRRELEAVAAVADELRIPAGRELMRQGTRGRELVGLLEGEVEVSRNGAPVATRGAGDFLGELALVTHRPRTATVTATTDLRVLVLEGGAFERLVRDVPSIALKVLKAVGERLPPEDA